MAAPPEPDETLASVERALDVVEALWKLDGAGVTELAEELGAAKSTVHGHLRTLHRKGYVVRDEERYRLSLRFLTFGEHVQRSEPLYEVAKPEVEELAARTGWSALCMVEQHGLGAVVCYSRGDRSIQTDVSIGTHTYLHCSAGGKAMLANMPEDRVDEIVDRWGLEGHTDDTITDRAELRRELERIRDRGVAYGRREYLKGISAVGAAITDDEGTVHGSISISGPARQFEEEETRQEVTDELLSALNVVEVNIQFAPD